MTLTCVACEATFERRSMRGKTPLYCSPACRQGTHYNRNRDKIIARTRAWRQAHPEHKERTREAYLPARFNLTVDQYETMLAGQGGRCAICNTDDPGGKSWQVDHDHRCCDGVRSCGECVRGLLCSSCNRGLGYLKDSPEVLTAALEYVQSTRHARAAVTRGAR